MDAEVSMCAEISMTESSMDTDVCTHIGRHNKAKGTCYRAKETYYKAKET